LVSRENENGSEENSSEKRRESHCCVFLFVSKKRKSRVKCENAVLNRKRERRERK